MNKQKDALKLALEAFAFAYNACDDEWVQENKIIPAIAKCEEALAQLEQEPVATTYKEVTDAMNLLLNGDYKQVQIAQIMADAKLYTAPPQRQPLTDEQIDIGRRAPWGLNLNAFTAGVRFAEAAHKIT